MTTTTNPHPEASHLKDPTLFRTRLVIGASRPSSHSNATFDVVYPGDGSTVIATLPESDAADVDDAVASCYATFCTFSTTTARHRSTLLRALYDLTIANVDDLARLIHRETGKPLAEAQGEVQYAASFISWFANLAEAAMQGSTIAAANPSVRMSTIKQPIGVTACLLPWNLPLAMATRKIAPALAAGCTCLVKPSGETPLSMLAFAELVKRAGFPDGAVNVVTSLHGVEAVGRAICEHPLIRKVSLTGSTRVGKLIAAQSAGTLKKLSMELGGNAPVLVFDDADLAKAVDAVLLAKMRMAGQTCIAANRILVQQGVFDDFVRMMKERLQGWKVGDGADSDTKIGPLISARAVEKCRTHVEDALSKGATLHYTHPSIPAQGHFYPPTILTNLSDSMLISHAETFGPVAALRPFSTEAQALAIANNSDVGLGAYLFTTDLRTAARLSTALDVGMIGINTGMLSACEGAFGGVKASGFGREGSTLGIDEYLVVKTITTDISG